MIHDPHDETLPPIYPGTAPQFAKGVDTIDTVFLSEMTLPDVTLPDLQSESTMAYPPVVMGWGSMGIRESTIYERSAQTITRLRALEMSARQGLRRLAPHEMQNVDAFRPHVAAAYLDTAFKEIQTHDAAEEAVLFVYHPFLIQAPLAQVFDKGEFDSKALLAAYFKGCRAGVSAHASFRKRAPDSTTLLSYAPSGTPIDTQIGEQPLCHVELHAKDDRLRSALRLAYDSMVMDAFDAYQRLTRP